MATAMESAPPAWTVADLFAHFGLILHVRIRQNPPPGSATAQDVIDIYDREKRLYELVDGVLVEKTTGIQESFLALLLGRLLGNYAEPLDLGFVLGTDGMARLAPGVVRIPDVSFISWNHFPDHLIPHLPMLNFAPDLALEVLSPSNTAREMERKLHDYFTAGVRLLWYIDPVPRTVQVFTAADQVVLLDENQQLTGEPVLPGFVLPLRELFAQLGQ